MVVFAGLSAILIFSAILRLAVVGSDMQPPTGEPGDKVRIVSLSPAISQMLIDMDVADKIVGVAEQDAAAPPGLPVVGNFLDVNTEKLFALEPTHVLTMAGYGGVPDSLSKHAQAMGLLVVGYPVPRSIEQISTIIVDETANHSAGPRDLGTLLGLQERARALTGRMRSRLELLRSLTATSSQQPRVLLVFSVDPNVMASGPGTVLDSLLGYVGAVNAAAEATSTAPTFDREKLLATDPDVVLLLLPDAPPLKGIDEDSRLAAFRGLDIAAVRTGRIHLINDSFALLPSSTAPRIATAIARTIHPELAETIARQVSAVPERRVGSAPASTTGPTRYAWPSGNLGDAIVRVFLADLMTEAPAMSFMSIRLLRLVLAVIVGAALAIGGVALQSLLRNPLAEPYILGLSSGAAVGVVLQMILSHVIGQWIGATHLGALAGAIGSMCIVYVAGRRRGVIDPLGLLLVGVVLSTINGAIIMLLHWRYSPPGLRDDVARWMMGYLNETVGSTNVLSITVLTVACFGLLFRYGPAMDASGFSDAEAMSVGVNLSLLRKMLFVVAGVLAAGAVVLAGPIAFVGLICPHVARLLLGPSHRPLLVAAAMTGAALIVLADTATVLLDFGHGRMPIGIFTAMIGGPAFLWMLRPHLGRATA